MKTTFSLTDVCGLMPRDRWAIDLLAEHRALTSEQFTALGYDSTPAAAGRRLRALVRLGWLVRVDSAWLLGSLGVQLRRPVADEPGLTTNQFFVDLAASARTQAGADLRGWRSVPAPYGEFLHHGKRIGFWYQRDPGGPPSRWLRRYRSLAADSGVSLLLVTTDDPDRFGRHSDGLIIATSRPGELAWQVCGERLALHELPEAEQLDPSVHPIYDPQRPYDEAVADGVYSYVRA